MIVPESSLPPPGAKAPWENEAKRNRGQAGDRLAPVLFLPMHDDQPAATGAFAACSNSNGCSTLS